jgi:transaldolase
MKFFVDTANTSEIKLLADGGLPDCVTTDRSVVAKTGKKFTDIIREFRAAVAGSISAAVTATNSDGMVREASVLRETVKNVTIKVPLTLRGERPRSVPGRGGSDNCLT